MLRSHTRISRIPGPATPSLTPRVASSNRRLPCRRPFTQKPALQILSTPRTRPQSSFLSPSPINRALPPLTVHLRQHYARLFSTESRTHFRRRMSRILRFSLSFGAILVFYEIIKIGIYQEELEHKWPTPPEWSWKSRWCLRAAAAWQHPEEIGKLLSDWPMVAGYLKELLMRLEDTELDGKGIVEQEDGGIYIEGVGRTGFDITAKSEPWRRGYFQALMGSAKAAENLEGWLTDRVQRVSAPAEYFVGPSNPRPKPVPKKQKVPFEENSEPASPSPEVFYMKILTTRGFATRQKVEAALAYADYLDYKGLQDTAADMYTWAMDIAAAGSPGDAASVVDVKTGVIKNNGQASPSENILRVSTALAVHHAKFGNLPTALSIFTSVLKARRALPSPPPGTLLPPPPPALPKRTSDPFRSFFNTLRTVLVPVEYPPPAPSGNEPPLRTAMSPCDEAGLMTYIGEIIFASSSEEIGLAWTRDAVDIAESTLLQLDTSTPQNQCADCVRVGLENWKTMISRLVKKALQEEAESVEKGKNKGSWFGPSKSQIEAKTNVRKRWEAEQSILDDRITRLRPVIVMESAFEGVVSGVGLFV
ncbi:hypothetical protein BJY01DRAFT_206140 [Aspergillus pseudoustus]|uniref:MFS maltose permease n=1 Tax=Aspergillus pseudoustus TaxID=1810923 RepID=A0ABR4KNS5_9EURO